MSRIADKLYFAPDLLFTELDWTGMRLPGQFRQRIHGLYLAPAIILARNKHAFAAGVLTVCAIDALAKMKAGSNAGNSRITAFCQSIPDLAGKNADLFCKHFRNGLLHEARVTDGSEFSLDIGRVAESCHERLSVNPLLLAKRVVFLLDEYVASLQLHPDQRNAFRKTLKGIFSIEYKTYPPRTSVLRPGR
jgi:hypothetical protein